MGGGEFKVTSAYTPSGEYIGNPKTAHYLVIKRGITPELATPKNNVCSVGYCTTDGKWYGWSHRAIVGFGIGNKVFEERWEPDKSNPNYETYAKECAQKEYCDSPGDAVPFIEHGTVTIETLTQAREAAVAFANYIA